jgi:hypothetical protein
MSSFKWYRRLRKGYWVAHKVTSTTYTWTRFEGPLSAYKGVKDTTVFTIEDYT